mgnify:CR=1 FL=1
MKKTSKKPWNQSAKTKKSKNYNFTEQFMHTVFHGGCRVKYKNVVGNLPYYFPLYQ